MLDLQKRAQQTTHTRKAMINNTYFKSSLFLKIHIIRGFFQTSIKMNLTSFHCITLHFLFFSPSYGSTAMLNTQCIVWAPHLHGHTQSTCFGHQHNQQSGWGHSQCCWQSFHCCRPQAPQAPTASSFLIICWVRLSLKSTATKGNSV